MFLDPGTKFCPYGILDWRYTAVDGLREDPGKGTQFTKTPNPQYSQALRTRRADVSLDERGSLSGTVALVYKGMAAMEKRQEGGKTDAEGRKKMLEDELRELLPGNSEVSIFNDPDWDDTEKPLIAQFRVKCPFATAAGKRLMLSQHLFQVNEKPRFPSATRAQAVYFPYPWTEADEVAIQLPSGMSVESLAPDDSFKLKFAFYQSQHKQQAPDKIFLHRDFIMGTHFLPVENYQEVKGFFDKVKADDAQPTIVRSASSVAAN